MADRLSCFFLRLRAVPAVGAWLMASICAHAEPLPDPTRPAPGFGSETPGAVGAPVAVGETGPVLQTVILPRKGKPKAMIGGELVSLGGRYGDQKLVKVSEREVVLEGPRGREVLTLTPGIEKKNVKRSSTRPVVGASKP